MKHWHHIIPKHMGGTDDSSNLIELTNASKQKGKTWYKDEITNKRVWCL